MATAPMSKSILLSKPFLISLLVHLLVFAVAMFAWQGSNEPKRIKPPRYIEAKLVKLKQETKKLKKKKQNKKIDLTKRKKPPAPKKAKAKPAPKATPKKDLKKEKQERLEQEKRKREEQRKREQQQRMLELEQALKDEEQAVAEQELESEAQSYIDAISQRIEQNWSRPPSARNGMRCELLIQLVPTGRVVSVSVEDSSGNAAFDRSAEQAVIKSEVFPEIKTMSPAVFEKYYRELRLVFTPQDLRQ